MKLSKRTKTVSGLPLALTLISTLGHASATGSDRRWTLLLHDWWRSADPAAGEHRNGDRHDRRLRRVGIQSDVRRF